MEELNEELKNEESKNEELEIDEDKSEDSSESDESIVEDDKEGKKNTVKVELLPLPTKKDVEEEIGATAIDPSLPLEERINKCRFKEELSLQIKNINFEELIITSRFEGDTDAATNYEKLQIKAAKLETTLPTKKEYISKELNSRKLRVEHENRKREESAKPIKPKEKAKPKTYKYPFILHFAGQNIETDHIFENGKEYEESEITKKMLEHQYYEFAGSVSYTFMEKENVLLPIFQQFKKG